MSITSQVQKDIVESMKKRQELRLSTLRMVKSALKNKEIDKRAPLDEKEEMQVLSTLIKQRHDASEQFVKGNRPELAAKELEEIVFIESYLPKAVGQTEIEAAVKSVITEMGFAHRQRDGHDHEKRDGPLRRCPHRRQASQRSCQESTRRLIPHVYRARRITTKTPSGNFSPVNSTTPPLTNPRSSLISSRSTAGLA